MRRGILIILAAWLSVFLQSTLGGAITIAGMAPDLLCILIMLAALRMGPLAAMRIGFLGGFLADCYHPATMGLGAACYTAAGYAGGAVRDRLYPEKLSGQVAASAALSLVVVPVVAALRSGGSYGAILLRHGIGSAAYTAAAALALLPLYNRILFPPSSGRGR